MYEYAGTGIHQVPGTWYRCSRYVQLVPAAGKIDMIYKEGSALAPCMPVIIENVEQCRQIEAVNATVLPSGT